MSCGEITGRYEFDWGTSRWIKLVYFATRSYSHLHKFDQMLHEPFTLIFKTYMFTG